jgi:hypothetical protein
MYRNLGRLNVSLQCQHLKAETSKQPSLQEVIHEIENIEHPTWNGFFADTS